MALYPSTAGDLSCIPQAPFQPTGYHPSSSSKVAPSNGADTGGCRGPCCSGHVVGNRNGSVAKTRGTSGDFHLLEVLPSGCMLAAPAGAFFFPLGNVTEEANKARKSGSEARAAHKEPSQPEQRTPRRTGTKDRGQAPALGNQKHKPHSGNTGPKANKETQKKTNNNLRPDESGPHTDRHRQNLYVPGRHSDPCWPRLTPKPANLMKNIPRPTAPRRQAFWPGYPDEQESKANAGGRERVTRPSEAKLSAALAIHNPTLPKPNPQPSSLRRQQLPRQREQRGCQGTSSSEKTSCCP